MVAGKLINREVRHIRGGIWYEILHLGQDPRDVSNTYWEQVVESLVDTVDKIAKGTLQLTPEENDFVVSVCRDLKERREIILAQMQELIYPEATVDWVLENMA